VIRSTSSTEGAELKKIAKTSSLIKDGSFAFQKAKVLRDYPEKPVLSIVRIVEKDLLAGSIQQGFYCIDQLMTLAGFYEKVIRARLHPTGLVFFRCFCG
jgi:hypothetical protein